MDNLGIRITALDQMMVLHLEHLQNLNHTITDGFKKIDVLQNDVNSLKVDVKGMKGDITSLKGDVNSLKRDVNSLKGGLKLLKGNSTASMETIEVKLSELTLEIRKINEVTQYKGIFDNLKMVKK